MIDTDTAIEGIDTYLRACVAAWGGRMPEGYAYGSLEEFVLRHGQPWTPGSLPKGVRRRTPRECYSNTYRLVASPQGQRLKLRYVEGYAVGLIPTLHAWAVTPEGTVVDTTWTPDQQHAYFGIAFPLELVSRTAAMSGYWAMLDNWHDHYPLLQQPFTQGEPQP